MKCRICSRIYGDGRRKRCNSCNTKIRRYRVKQAGIKLLGGKCNRCDWEGHPAAFEFHHKDPSQKEFSIGSMANKSWSVVKKELLKCELLCSNCHQIEHATEYTEVFLKEIEEYGGTILK